MTKHFFETAGQVVNRFPLGENGGVINPTPVDIALNAKPMPPAGLYVTLEREERAAAASNPAWSFEGVAKRHYAHLL